jgi:predicted dehydrogenase
MGPFEEIHGFWDNFNHPYIEVEDSAVAAIRFRNGALGSVLVSNSQKPGIYAKVHVHGSSAFSMGVQTDGGAMFIAGMSGVAEPPLNDLWTIEGERDLLDTYRQEDTVFFRELEARGAAIVYFFTCQIDDFCGAIRNGRPPAVSGEAGRETVRFIERLLKTGRIGGPSRR